MNLIGHMTKIQVWGLLAAVLFTVSCQGEEPMTEARSEAPPDHWFVKTPLKSGGLDEPMEMAILPNLDILVAQRKGEIMLYKQSTQSYEQAGFLDVYHYTPLEGVNAEEGVMGLALDPGFEQNRQLFLFYASADTSVNRLSRFRFEQGQLVQESEQVILEFHSQRNICCHTGGSIAFDSEGLLYLSTGDNSTPFNQPDTEVQLLGYAPLDNREGFEQYDARRTSGNSNDLRGKVIRIRVNEDGSYDIPEGNLYPEGMEKTRPEIYVQGTRNAFRISVDPKNGYLYWGDVGPDARRDSLEVRGPKGYDELNQAREAGHFGWPYFIADNIPYNEYDYANDQPGELFDPERPVNRSPNNSGVEVLPPANPAFIYYPYDESETFPEVGSGGRSIKAGPVYYSDLYPEESRLHDYFDGKLFFADWIRDWVMVVTMDEEGDYVDMEPFMESSSFYSVIDMEIGPDGKLYLLEYGKGWFTGNDNSGLYRIDMDPTRPEPVDVLPEDEVELARRLIADYGCIACHAEQERSVGPSFVEIAERYEGSDVSEQLKTKISEGGSGAWGPVSMPANPSIPDHELDMLVQYILGITAEGHQE